MAEPVPPPSWVRRAAALSLGAVGVALVASPVESVLVGGAAPLEAGDAVETPAEHVPGRLVLDVRDDASPEAVAALEAAAGIDLEAVGGPGRDDGLYAGDVPDLAAAVDALRGNPLVEEVEPSEELYAIDPEPSAAEGPTGSAGIGPGPRRSFGYPDDPELAQQWNLGLIGAEAGWRVGGGRGVIVAVIDTGVSPLPDLPAERILPGRSFVPGTTSAADDQGHGTHVAGTIGQATNNGVGVAGIAPEVTILPIKVLAASGGGRTEWIAAGIDEACDQGAQVINLSLGGGHSDVIVRAVERARKRGVVVVAAAGNTGREGLGSPADAKSALGVSSVGPGDTLAPYSTWGKGVEISAPGGDTSVTGGGILQATVDGKGGQQLVAWQGTSMASPHVAGAAAVLLGAGARDAAEVESLLMRSAVGKGDAQKYGAGRLDVAAAVRTLLVARRGLLFVSGGVVALALSVLAGLPKLARTVAVTSGALVAGGAFFLPLLPLPPSGLLRLVSEPLLAWPPGLVAGFPLWQSALLPLVLGLVLGASRTLGPVVLGLAAGVGAYLLHGAATGSSGLWWLPLGWGGTWLSLNGTAALVIGMAVAGMQRLRRRG